jgi:hypothetical protein
MAVAQRLQALSATLDSPSTPTMTEYKFYGWVGKDKDSIGNLTWEEYEPKKWTEDDVDIKISMTLCGIEADGVSALWDLCVGFAYPTLGLGSNELSCCCGS